MVGPAIGPCGCDGAEHAAAVKALVAMTEEYGCGDFSLKHLQAAQAAGQVDRVADFLNGTWVSCSGGSEWCHPDPMTAQQARNFSPDASVFTTAIRNKIMSPDYVFEGAIANDARVHGRVEEVVWACGWHSTDAVNKRPAPADRIPYGTIEITLKSPATEADLRAFQEVTRDAWQRWSGQRIDPTRITARRGADQHVDTPSHHDTNLPTIKIEVAPPRSKCAPQEGRPSS